MRFVNKYVTFADWPINYNLDLLVEMRSDWESNIASVILQLVNWIDLSTVGSFKKASIRIILAA